MGVKNGAGLWLALAFASLAAQADSGYVDIEQRLSAEQRRSTGLDTLSSEQLKLLNQLLRVAATEASSAAEEESPQKPVAMPSEAPQPKPAATTFFTMDNTTIKSRLKGAVSSWDAGTVFELENGQKWRVMKGRVKLPAALQAPEVWVVPGIAGRWFLQVDENYPKARVERIE